MALTTNGELKPVVAIAGASGFVGTALRRTLAESFTWQALTRSETISGGSSDPTGTLWRHCDLYSLPQVREALRGADYAVYLVHSMHPSTRLVQGSFQDMDLLLADNFVRGAEEAGVRHIIYLGGLLPADDVKLSPHLESRREVEAVLRSRSIPVTVLRAGLIFGPGGSSFGMLVKMVRRLPVLVLPGWTRSRTHSIDIRDVVRAFAVALEDGNLRGGTYDLGGHEPMSYGAMIRRTARLLGRKRLFVTFPFSCFLLSRGWVSLFSGLPGSLVNPLLESLRHSLEARPNALLDRIRPDAVPFERSLLDSVAAEASAPPHPRQASRRKDLRMIQRSRRVRSVQRMYLPDGYDAAMVAERYGDWLTYSSGRLLAVTRSPAGALAFRLWPLRSSLLELTPTPESRTGGRRRAFYISGGLLTRAVEPPGRLEFRVFPENRCVIAAIHGFAPCLPWWLYRHTQALVHLTVMRAFSRHLRRIGRRDRA